MKHLTTEQAHVIFAARLDIDTRQSWKNISEELGITPSRLRADRQTKTYLELAFAYCARYGFGTELWTLRQAGCLHPDIAAIRETWHGNTQRIKLKNTCMVYDDGGRTERDLHLANPVGYVGDCVIRATAIALDRDYAAVWNAMDAVNRRDYQRSVDTGTYPSVSAAYLRDAGWVKIALTWTADAKDIAAKLKGERAILFQTRHAVAVVDGVCHDTWRSAETLTHRVREGSRWIQYGIVTGVNEDGTQNVHYNAHVEFLYVPAERLAAVQWLLRDNLTMPKFKPIPVAEKVSEDLPRDCELKRGSDAYERLVDAAVERVLEDVDPDDDAFQDLFEDTWHAMLEERNITIVAVRRFI